MVHPQTKKKLKALISRYLRGKTSPAESQFIESYYDYAEGKVARDEQSTADLTAVGLRLHERISQGIAEQEPTVTEGTTSPHVIPLLIHTRIRKWGWVAAAVAVVMVFGGGIYWYGYRQKNAGQVVAGMKPSVPFDAPPGHTGAVLTLADGKQITLDSAPNGTLASQGKTRLLKKAGVLQYKSGATETTTILYNTMTTPRGRQYQLVLSDGTRVWLNAASSIRFPTAFTGKERRVTITGEAYLEVAKNASMPFVVQTAHYETQVLGTAFDIMDYPDEPRAATTLVEGSVKVVSGTDRVILTPGEQARLNAATGKVSLQSVDTDPVIAWTKDQLSLGSTDLASLMRQLSRWYDVDITFQGTVPDIRIWGVLDRNVSLSTVLKYMEENGLHYKTERKTIIILP